MPGADIQPGVSRQSIFSRLSRPQWLLIFMAAGLVLTAILLLMMRGSGPDLVPLYINMSMDDAANVVAKLKEMGIRYSLTDGGRTVMVPSKDLYDLRLQLASEGLPAGGAVGFEIFDKTNFGATEFSQRVNYLRALQGELTRTIMQMAEVDQARVHLVIPEQELYLQNEKPATASVMLKLKPNASLSKKQVQGIRHLVASAVEGLKPENVTVLDIFGNVLSQTADSPDALTGTLSLSQLEAKRAFEKELESSIASMLESVLGPGKSSVRVSADIDFNQEETSSEIYEPGANGLGVVRSRKTLDESFSSTEGQGAGAVPGVSSNVPAGLAGAPTYQGAAGGGTSQQTRREETVNYEITRRIEKRVKAPAKINRLSVAAIVDGNLTPAQINSITQAVSAAAGIDPARGDTVVVEAMPFDRSFLNAEMQAMAAEASKAATSKGFNLMRVLPYIIAGFVLLLLIVILLVRARRRRLAAAGMAPQAAAIEEGPEAPLPAEAAPEKAQEPEIEFEEGIESKIEQLVMSKPDVAARVIETFLSE